MTSEEAIRQLRNTDASAHAPEALQHVIDAVQELAALKAMRALSSRPPTLESAHSLISMMDTEVTGAMADTVSLRKRLQEARAAFLQMRDAWVIGTADDAQNALRVLGQTLGVDDGS